MTPPAAGNNRGRSAVSAQVPFTPAHVVAVLPLVGRPRLRGRLDATALVIGSVAPDFDYFLHGRMQGSIAHTWIGLFVFDLPVTLALCCVWRWLCAEPLILGLPGCVRRRIDPAPAPTGPLAALVLAALIGSLTHLLWDGFTHATGPFVAAFPGLRGAVIVPGMGSVPLYRALQHSSSVCGLVLVAVWVWVRLRQRPLRPARPESAVRLATPVLSGAGAASGVAVGLSVHGATSATISHVVVLAIDGCLLGLVAGSLVVQHLLLRRGIRPKPPARPTSLDRLPRHQPSLEDTRLQVKPPGFPGARAHQAGTQLTPSRR